MAAAGGGGGGAMRSVRVFLQAADGSRSLLGDVTLPLGDGTRYNLVRARIETALRDEGALPASYVMLDDDGDKIKLSLEKKLVIMEESMSEVVLVATAPAPPLPPPEGTLRTYSTCTPPRRPPVDHTGSELTRHRTCS